MKTQYFAFITLITVFIFNPIFGQKVKDKKMKNAPEWVKKKPTSNIYYIGIGYADKTSENYLETAKANALRDLTSEIIVKVSSVSQLHTVETNDDYQEKFDDQIKNITRSSLQDYEKVDTWEDTDKYWVYYRISKTTYKMQRKQAFDQAVKNAKMMYENGQKFEAQNDVYRALLNYMRAMVALQPFLGDAIEVEYNGKSMQLVNQLYTKCVNLLSDVKFEALNDGKISAKYGKLVDIPLEAKVTYKNSNLVKSLPVTYSFAKGSGNISDASTVTNSEGVSKATLNNLTSADKVQKIEAKIDFKNILGADSTGILVFNYIGGLPEPKTSFDLGLKSMRIYIHSDEYLFDEKLDINEVQPIVKNYLKDHGINFTTKKDQAEYILNIKAKTKKGTQAGNMASAYLDVIITLIDSESGDEVYAKAQKKIKGVKFDFENAAYDAYNKSQSKLKSDILPDLIEFIESN